LSLRQNRLEKMFIVTVDSTDLPPSVSINNTIKRKHHIILVTSENQHFSWKHYNVSRCTHSLRNSDSSEKRTHLQHPLGTSKRWHHHKWSYHETEDDVHECVHDLLYCRPNWSRSSIE
jgi:hypothetical protein